MALWALGCPTSPTADAPDDPGDPARPGAAVAEAKTDPLLARARGSIRDGRVARDVAAEIRASKDPAHARAARLLTAFDADIPEAAKQARDEPDEAPVADPSLPPVRVPDEDGDTPPPPTPPAAMPPPSSPAATPSPTPAAPPKPPKPTVSSLAMNKTTKGATLTIKADGGVTVGVANQLASGIVHLVIEGATASPKIAAARPSVTGAKVTRVRKGQGTVQITLDLEPGWTLGKVSKFAGGAKVRLVAPP